jgi:hypothetical protein
MNRAKTPRSQKKIEDKKRKNNRKKTKIIVDFAPKLWQKARVLFVDTAVLFGSHRESQPLYSSTNEMSETTSVQVTHTVEIGQAVKEFFRLQGKAKTAESKAETAKSQANAAKVALFGLCGQVDAATARENAGENGEGSFSLTVQRNVKGDLAKISRSVSVYTPKPKQITRVVDRVGLYCGK